MEIRIKGKFERNNRSIFTQNEIDGISWNGDGFVFVDYLEEDVFLGDVFVLKNGTEIILKEIRLQYNTEEPLTMMGHGWKCLCKFDNLDLDKVPAVKDWFDNIPFIVAIKKN